MYLSEILATATDFVATYISRGYTLSPTMSGHQGEVLKVDLTNGTEVIRVVVNSFTHYVKDIADIDDICDGVKILVEKFTDLHTTLWTGSGEALYNFEYYKLSRGVDHKDKAYYTTNMEDIRHKNRVHYSRIKNSPDKKQVKFTSDRALEIALKYVKKQSKCKTKTIKDIDSIVKTNTGYRIALTNGRGFWLN